jgi:antitoxin (DNA-binding transcriptional repressor) of toxin-antitoxin stability system
MKHMSAEEASINLPQLLQQLQAGEELLLEIEGKVVAKVTSVIEPQGPPYRMPGFAKGEFRISDDFDEPLEDFAPYM